MYKHTSVLHTKKFLKFQLAILRDLIIKPFASLYEYAPDSAYSTYTRNFVPSQDWISNLIPLSKYMDITIN